MTRIAKRTPYVTPLVTACALKHHRPGARVVFSEWCPERRSTVKRIGRVITHIAAGRTITIALTPSGRRVTTECGHVARAGT